MEIFITNNNGKLELQIMVYDNETEMFIDAGTLRPNEIHIDDDVDMDLIK